jgi:lipopolysaccharide export system protein LptA
MYRIYYFVLFFLSAAFVQAQTTERVTLEYADRVIGINKDGRNFNRLIGNVRLSQKETKMYADSAYLYRDTNSFEAFGNVRIYDGDSVTIFADYLNYDGNIRLAKLRNNVRFSDMIVTLYTENLDYDRLRYRADYFDKGRLVDSTNVLTSVFGTYRTISKIMNFRKDVVLVNPEYTMYVDSLDYNTINKEAKTIGYTRIIDKEGKVLIAEEGSTYQTDSRQSQFTDGVILTDSYELGGDILSADELRQIYKATNNVTLWSKEDSVLITGLYGEYYKAEGFTKIYGNALMRKIKDGDTTYIRSDTLISFEYEDKTKNLIKAFNRVKIYNHQFAGKADSLTYSFGDSTLYFFYDPVLWTEKNQLTGDKIEVEFKDDKLHQARVRGNSFAVNLDTLENFNQIKGRDMTANFVDDVIKLININGNGQSIFFALNDSTMQVMGMNKITCSDIRVQFNEGYIDKIAFLGEPEADFVPPHEIKGPDSKLPGFLWKIDDKPTLVSIFKVDEPKKEKEDDEKEGLDEDDDENKEGEKENGEEEEIEEEGDIEYSDSNRPKTIRKGGFSSDSFKN